MSDGNPQAIYAALVQAAKASITARTEVATTILRAYDAGWETGDIFEALNEGDFELSFGTIEALAQSFGIKALAQEARS